MLTPREPAHGRAEAVHGTHRAACSPGPGSAGQHPRSARRRARAALTSRPSPLPRDPPKAPRAPADMEFVSGYRDEFLDFTALLFGWFRKFVAERGAVGASLEGRWRQLEAQIRRLPQDSALWVLHVLPNSSVGISLGQGAEPGPGPGLEAARLLGDEPPLHLRDLSPYVSFVSLEEGEEDEEDEESGQEKRAGAEKAGAEEGREPVPTSRASPQEANPAGEPEETKKEVGGGEDGCREDRVEDTAGREKRKGHRSGENPGLPSRTPLLKPAPS